MTINQLTFLGSNLRDFIVPLQEDFANLESLEFLFSRYGWKISLDDVVFNLINDRSNIVLPLAEFIQTANSIEETLASNGNSTPSASQLEELLGKAQSVFRAVAGLSISSFSGLPEPLNQELFWRDISNHVLDDLLERFMRIHYSKGYLVAHLFGIIRYDLVEPENIYQRQYVKTLVDWDQALNVIKNPLHAIKKTYDWDGGEKPFDNQRLFEMLHRILRAVGISANLVVSDGKTLAGIATDKPYTVKQDEDGLWVEILYDMSINDPTIFEIAVELLPAIKDTQMDTSGVFVRPIVRGANETALSLSSNLKLVGSLAADMGQNFAAVIFPDRTEWATSDQSSANAKIELQHAPVEPIYMLGNATTARLEILGGTVGLSMGCSTINPEIYLYARAEGTGEEPGCKVVIPLGESDAFIKEEVKADSIEFSFRAEIILSNRNGLQFNTSSTLDFTIPLRLNVGGFILEDTHIQVLEKTPESARSAITLRVDTTIKGGLGPIEFTIRGMGLDCTASNYTSEELINLPPAKEPLFGNIDLELKFAPPTGLGLSIDGGGFKGGGLVDFDPDKQRYVGFLELEFKNKISLKALGLLTTSLPDGSNGYSLLIIITAEFNPIQLGLGFTLNGVGGLLGLNRTANVERLCTGVKDNTLSSILFPQDIVTNASRIISDLRQVFPPKKGRFIFGPMMKIAWGTPTLITTDVGLMIEVPSPVRLHLLGVVRAQIPNEEQRLQEEENSGSPVPKLLQLQVNFLGVVDFDAKKLSFDASLYDSKLLYYILSGDMAVRFSWGDEPNFLMTIGGFNPAYEPPPLALPNLQRITLSLLSGNNPRITMETYYAVTSNTVQFGARLELYAEKSKFNVSGFLSYDVLFQFNPFYFIADIGAMLALRVGSREIASINLSLTLDGPTPWHAKGTAKLKICWFFTLKIRFNKTFGNERNARLDDVAVLPLLQVALSNKGNWESTLSSSGKALVSVKEVEVGGNGIVVDPNGVLSISQKVVPLKTTIQKFGSQFPSDAYHFDIEKVKVGEGSDAEFFDTTSTQESFAPAQFFERTDAQKLSSPSFERRDSGVKLAQSEKKHGSYTALRLVEYELFYSDEQRNQRIHRRPGLFLPDHPAFKTLSSKGAVATSPLSYDNKPKPLTAPGAIKVMDERFTVVNVKNMKAVNAESFMENEMGAHQLMDEILNINPALEGELQVIPTYEMDGVIGL